MNYIVGREGGYWKKAPHIRGKKMTIVRRLRKHCVVLRGYKAFTYYNGEKLHAVLFPDGSVWDSLNDLRDIRYPKNFGKKYIHD